MPEAKAYLPPKGPAHGADYDWYDGQGAHRIGNSTVPGHEEVIVTRSSIAQRNCEHYGLEELPGDLTEEIAEARADGDDDRTAQLVADYRSGGDETGEAVAEDEHDRPGVPDDDELAEMEYRDLQDLAGENGIAANQSAEDLREQLAAIRDGAESDRDETETGKDETETGKDETGTVRVE